jgi:hypothetical protein
MQCKLTDDMARRLLFLVDENTYLSPTSKTWRAFEYFLVVGPSGRNRSQK